VHGSPHRAGAASARPKRVHPMCNVLCRREAVGLDDAGEGADVPEGKEKGAALTVVFVMLDQLLMYWDRPLTSKKSSSIAVQARKNDLLFKSIRLGAGCCPRWRPQGHGDLVQTRTLVDRTSDYKRL